MWDDLSPKQSRTLEFIIEYIKEHSYPPTYREIAKNQRISIKSVSQRLNQLKRKGYIQIRKNIPRGIVLTDKAGVSLCKTVSLKMYRKIDKYKKNFKLVDFESTVSLSTNIFPRDDISEEKTFLLKIHNGTNVENYLGFDVSNNDIIIIQKESSINENDKVVSIYDNKIVIGRVSKIEDFFVIQAKRGVIPIGGSNAVIVGKILSIMKFV